MQKTRKEYEKPEVRKVALVPSEAVLCSCKTGQTVCSGFLSAGCAKWWTSCREAGS